MHKRFSLLVILLVSTFSTTIRSQGFDAYKGVIYFAAGHISNYGWTQFGRHVARQLGYEPFHTARRLIKVEIKHFGNSVMAKFYLGNPIVRTMTEQDVTEGALATLIEKYPTPIGYPDPVIDSDNYNSATYHVKSYTPHFRFIQLDPNLANKNTWQGKWYAAGAKALTAYDIMEFLVQGSRYLVAAHEGKNTTDVSPQNPLIPYVTYNTTDCHIDHNAYDWRKTTSRVYDTITSGPSVFTDLAKLTIKDPTLVISFIAHFATAWGMMELTAKIAEVSGSVIVVSLHITSPSWGHHAQRFFDPTNPSTLQKMYLTLFSFPLAASVRPALIEALHEGLEKVGWYNHNAEHAYECAYGAGDKFKWGWPGFKVLAKALLTLPPLYQISQNTFPILEATIAHKKTVAQIGTPILLASILYHYRTAISSAIQQTCSNEDQSVPFIVLCSVLMHVVDIST